MFLRSYITGIAFAALFLFLAFVVLDGPAPIWLAGALGTVGVGLLAGSTIAAIRAKRDARYSLTALKELHEAGGPVDESDIPEVPDDAGVLCPCCHQVYARWMKACPHCRR